MPYISPAAQEQALINKRTITIKTLYPITFSFQPAGLTASYLPLTISSISIAWPQIEQLIVLLLPNPIKLPPDELISLISCNCGGLFNTVWQCGQRI